MARLVVWKAGEHHNVPRHGHVFNKNTSILFIKHNTINIYMFIHVISLCIIFFYTCNNIFALICFHFIVFKSCFVINKYIYATLNNDYLSSSSMIVVIRANSM